MTRQERLAICDLSLQVYGKKYAWQKMLKRGEFVEETVLSNNGNELKVKRQKHLTMTDVLARMQKVIEDKNAAAVKTTEEVTQSTTGDSNATEESKQEETNSQVSQETV